MNPRIVEDIRFLHRQRELMFQKLRTVERALREAEKRNRLQPQTPSTHPKATNL